MTYIVGIQEFGINAVICDTRVTWWRSNKKVGGANVSLKSGILFPGCLYAITGDKYEAGKFIKAFKQEIEGTRNTLQGLWNDFNKFYKVYFSKTGKKADFSLLLSSRCEGQPQFYLMDTENGIQAYDESSITLGSGKQVLDHTFLKLFQSRRSAINKIIAKGDLPQFTFPYFYCLWLNEIAQGDELSRLEQNDVGGIFHFLWQDSTNEYAQHPAVYVLSAANDDIRTIYIWIYIVAYIEDCLVVENPIIEATEYFFSSISRPSRTQDHYFNRWHEVVSEIDKQANSLPFYYFCGFGFPQITKRGPFGCHVTTINNYVIKKDGYLSPDYKSFIVKSLGKDYTMTLENWNII